MTKHQQVTCEECGEMKDIRAMYIHELFDTPWDDKSRIAYLCKTAPKKIRERHYAHSCEDLLSDSSWGDFRYFVCEDCGREICEQNPSNGWHTQVRVVDDCIQLCLKCYEVMILRDGISRETLEEGKLPGMFFSGNNSELTETGFECIEYYVYIRGTADAKALCAKALTLVDTHIVLFAYESMAIGGLEGYVSLYAKPRENKS